MKTAKAILGTFTLLATTVAVLAAPPETKNKDSSGRQPAGPAAWKDCNDDIGKYCKGGISDYAFQITSCLERNRDKLTQACQRTLDRESQKRHKMMEKSGE